MSFYFFKIKSGVQDSWIGYDILDTHPALARTWHRDLVRPSGMAMEACILN